jgi:hypothetical protein
MQLEKVMVHKIVVGLSPRFRLKLGMISTVSSAITGIYTKEFSALIFTA